jgi:hypothetical protein
MNLKPIIKMIDFNRNEKKIIFAEHKKNDAILNVFCEYLGIHN